VPNIDIPQYDVEALEDALAFLAEVFYVFEKRRDAFFYLMDNEPWDFFMPVFILHDRIQHLFWKYMVESFPHFHTEKGKIVRKKILACYQAFDTMLGQLETRIAGKDVDLFIISDHGFGSTRQWFNVNKWLEDLGILTLKPIEYMKKKLFFRAMLLNDSPLVRAVIPETLHRAIRKKVRQTRSTFKTDIDRAIDWNNTRAFFASIPCQGIFINSKRKNGTGVVSSGTEYEELRSFIRKNLLSIDDPLTGNKLIDRVWYREEIYTGPLAATAPDIIFVAQNYSTLGRQLLGAPRWLISSENVPNGFHRSNGVFIARGKHIKSNAMVSGLSILDIAPTILHAYGLPVPRDMDGQCLQDIFIEDYAVNNPVTYCDTEASAPGDHQDVYSEDDIARVEERLKGLGYIE
jgi:predicted AlkP superfamily phosphohydrolase/phosphomutase